MEGAREDALRAQGWRGQDGAARREPDAREGRRRAHETTRATRASAARSKPPANKADFVRSRSHLSPREVVEDAKAAGLEARRGHYVYNVRAFDKAKTSRGARAAAQRAVAPRSAPSVPRPIHSTASAEDLLRAVAAEIGLGRAIEILNQDRAKVRAVLGG